MKKNTTMYIRSVVLFLLLLTPFIIRAEPPTPPTPGGQQITITNPFNGGDNLIDFINAILKNVVMPIAAVAAVVYIIWAGFTYVMAQGKPAEIEKAHQRLLWALVGTGILLGAAGISQVIQSTVRSFLN